MPNSEILNEFISGSVSSKSLFIGNGKNRWEKVINGSDQYNNPSNAYSSTLHKVLYSISENIKKRSLIDVCILGCAGLEKEIQIVQKLGSIYNVNLILVDYSYELINKAKNEVDFSSMNSTKFLHIDFYSDDFHSFLVKNRTDNVPYLFLLLGFTIGNYDFKRTINWLEDITETGDYLWCDFIVQSDQKDQSTKAIKERTLAFNESSVELMEFIKGPLKELKIPSHTGFLDFDIIFEVYQEKQLRKVEYYYRFCDKYVLKNGKETTFNKGDKVKLLSIYHFIWSDVLDVFGKIKLRSITSNKVGNLDYLQSLFLRE